MSSSVFSTVKLQCVPKTFRFCPTDEDLITYYLRHKINGHHSKVDIIPEVDVCKWEPWDLPALSVIKSDEQEWFFFSPCDKKYRKGYRYNRATEAGYWKSTGRDRNIKSSSSSCTNSHIVGLKKSLIFYKGRAPKGEHTNWVIHEYRVNEPGLDGTASRQGDYVLCRLFLKADDKLNDNEVEHTESLPSCSTTKSTPEETVMEESLPFGDLDDEAAYNQFDGKIFGGLKPDSYADFGASPGSPFPADFGVSSGSPFSADFGNEGNGIHFGDGTSEPDASFSDALQGLQNYGVYDPSCVEGQVYPDISQVPQAQFDNAVEQDGSSVKTPVETFYHPDQIEDDGNPGGETGIKIHPPDGSTPINSTTPGSAPSKMHLALGYAPHSIDCDKPVSPPPLTPQATDGNSGQEFETSDFLSK